MNIYINVAIFGNVNIILFDLLNKIDISGLYEKCNKIYLILNGDIEYLNIDLKKDKYVIYELNKDISKCEFPTLELIWKQSRLSDDNILYIHTKGVTRNNQTIKDWTELLSYFNIIKWKDRINELNSYDCTGINLYGNKDDIKQHPATWGYGKAPLHYSGNFWWSKASHIRKLPNPISWLPDTNYYQWRIMAEMWVCQIEDAKYYSAFSSNVDHYTSLYPKKLYQT